VPCAAWILKKGAPQPDLKLASMTTFSVALPHTKAVPVSALSVPCCLLVAVAFCVAIPVWIYLLCSTICRAFPVCQGRLAQLAVRKALSLKIDGSGPPWSIRIFPPGRLLRQSCGCLPCRTEKSILVLSFSLSFRGCTCYLSSFLARGHVSLCVAVVVLTYCRC
jgi:hypothetical protein